MRGLSGCGCERGLRPKIDKPGCRRVTRGAVTIDAADDFCDSIANHRPVSHSLGRSKTWSNCITRFSKTANNGAAFGNLGDGL